MVDVKKLKMHLQAALDCLGDDEGGDEDAPEMGDESSDEGDDDMAMKSLKMKMKKYV